MGKLLEWLAKQCAFLFEGNRFRVVDSQASDSFGGDALVVLSSSTLRLRLVRDRDQIIGDCQSNEGGVHGQW